MYNQTVSANVPVIWPASWSPTQPSIYDLPDYTVGAGGNSNEVWTPGNNPLGSTGTNTIRIEKSLVVPPNTTLRIENMRVEFGPEGQVIIQSHQGGEVLQKAGHVRMINATLTTAAGYEQEDGKWKGVRIEGLSSMGQSPFLFSPDWQGTLVMENSEISNANYALDFWDGTLNKTGGRIRATNSRFLNNRKTAAFYPYRSYVPNRYPLLERPYEARFLNCDFTVDRALAGDFLGFISGWEINGLAINGCRFKNLSGKNTVYNYGIFGSMGVKVDGIYTSLVPKPGPPDIPTEFHNLKDAVHIGQLMGGINVNATVLNTKFYNCNVGVQSDGALGAVTVRNNIFDLKEGVGFTPDKKKGVFINTGTGFLINNNTFDNSLNSRKSPGTTGVLVWNSGSTNNVVNNNIYKSIYTGDLSNYQNRSLGVNPVTNNYMGLKFLCSDHYNNPFDIAARGNNDVTNGMHPLQLISGVSDNAVAAGNVFSYDRAWEVANYPGEVAALTYFYYSGGANQKPLNFPASTVTTIDSRDANCPDAGPVYNGEGPVRQIPVPVWPPRNLTSPGTTDATIERGEAIAYYVSDSAGMMSRDSLYMWLQLPDHDAYHDLMLTDMLLQDGRPDDATTVYDKIVVEHGLQGEEAEEFNAWGRRRLNIRKALLQTDRNMWQLNDLEKDTLNQVAEGGKMWAKVRAQSWLNMLNPELQFQNTLLFPYCEGDDCDEEGGQNKMAPPAAELPTIAQAAEKAVSISPNPTTGLVRISLNSTAQMVVTDLSGRVVFITSLKEGIQELSLSSLPAGTYLYRIQTSAGSIFTGKLTKQ